MVQIQCANNVRTMCEHKLIGVDERGRSPICVVRANAIITTHAVYSAHSVDAVYIIYAAIFARNAVGERARANCHSDAFKHYRVVNTHLSPHGYRGA